MRFDIGDVEKTGEERSDQNEQPGLIRLLMSGDIQNY